jgi:hypothetical protein
MKTVPISIAICGLVRDADRLMRKVTNYFDWHNAGFVGEIVYATWIGEIDRYPGLRKRLQDHAVTILEIEEPRLILKGGHQLHQMVAFHYALSALEDREQFVLKTRVDLADNHEIMLYEFEHGTEAADDFGGFGLRNRILVENAQMFYPFLCGDAQFFGRISDLRKLVNMSAEMEVTMNRLAVEQTFFFEPFKRSRLFRRHFYWNLPHISEIADRREQQLRQVWSSELIRLAVKAWWVVMDSYFKVGWGPRQNDLPEINSFERACSHDGFSKIIGGDRSDVVSNDAFVRALLALMLPEEIADIKVRVADQGDDNPFAVPSHMFDEYESFRRQFSDLPSAKAVCEGETKRQISGAAQHFFVKEAQDSASTRYHEQVTALRRENDYLKTQLNITLTNTFLHRLLSRVLPRSVIVFMKYRMGFLTDLYARYLMRKRG